MLRRLARSFYTFRFGAETFEYSHRVHGRVWLEPQVALSVRWDYDDSARTVQVKAGPVCALVCIARRRPKPMPEDLGATLASWFLPGGRDLHLWVNWRHLGVGVQWYPNRILRAEIGPLGAALIRT
jgi:hypothetical protein